MPDIVYRLPQALDIVRTTQLPPPEVSPSRVTAPLALNTHGTRLPQKKLTGGNQAVQVFVRHRIQFVELPVQIDVRTPEMPDEKFAERSILRVIEGQVCQKDRQAKYRH